jgi:hypothetical protein
MLPCKQCQQFNLEQTENIFKREGCTSSLAIEKAVIGRNYTSAKIDYFFEVNRRLVYVNAMRSAGCGALSAEHTTNPKIFTICFT